MIEWALPLKIYYLNFCISLLWFFYCHFSKQVSDETIERDSNMQHLIYFPREFTLEWCFLTGQGYLLNFIFESICVTV